RKPTAIRMTHHPATAAARTFFSKMSFMACLLPPAPEAPRCLPMRHCTGTTRCGTATRHASSSGPLLWSVPSLRPGAWTIPCAGPAEVDRLREVLNVGGAVRAFVFLDAEAAGMNHAHGVSPILTPLTWLLFQQAATYLWSPGKFPSQ